MSTRGRTSSTNSHLSGMHGAVSPRITEVNPSMVGESQGVAYVGMDT